jgi:hypothetical protein
VKNWKSLLLITLLCAALAHPTQAAQTIPSSQLLKGLYFKEGGSLQTQMTSVTGDVPGTPGLVCDSIEDSKCQPPGTRGMVMTAFLLPCSSSVKVGCIEEIYALDANNKKYPAKYSRVIAPNLNFGSSSFVEDVGDRRIAGSGVGNLWAIAELPNMTTPLELTVQVSLRGSKLSNNADWNYWSMEASMAATKQVVGNYRTNRLEFDPTTRRISGGDTIGSNNRNDDTCVATEVGLCFNRVEFPDNLQFGMSIKLPQALQGFFHGRINNPLISQKIENNRSITLSINANPVKVPFIREAIGYQSWSPELIAFTDKSYVCPDNLRCEDTSGGYMMPGVSGDYALQHASLFLPSAKDKESGSADFWSVRTLSGSSESDKVDAFSSCFARTATVAGIVTTNAMVYSAGPPSFNKETGALDYKVLSPHFDSSGNENSGTYDLVLRSDFARCIYGFSNAPIRAEISIVGASGEDKVATTVINEKDGWMYLSAKGFTFSSPTIRVKMSQEKVVEAAAPSTQASNAVKPAPVAKKSITCVKGKTTKKVVSANPKCPVGWKKR